VKVAIIGWGSLVWKPEPLLIVGNFEPTTLHLPIEICRISKNKTLTLAIDGTCGKLCPVYVATSGFDKLSDSIKDLREREETNRKNIGFVDLLAEQRSASAQSRGFKTVEIIKLWAMESGYDAAVWTALSSNFAETDKANEAFSIDAAIRYLERLNDETLDCALNYIRRAPAQVQTPVRAAVNARWPCETPPF